jgi:hypothetical protein
VALVSRADRSATSEGANPDTTARRQAEAIERVYPFPDLVDAVLAGWAASEGGERDLGGGD